MRLRILFLAALVLVAFSACGGEDDTGPPDPLEQRIVLADDAPGSKPDPVETQQKTAEFQEFVDTLADLAVDPHDDEMTNVFREAGFEAAIIDTRFYGEMHSPSATHIFSSAIQLKSEEGASEAREWLEADSVKPCPRTCAVEISEFDVDGIPDARGVRRTQTAEDIERVGTADDRPFDSYQAIFTDGPFVYTVDLHGQPGSVSEEQFLEIATAFYDRVDALSS